MITNLFLLKLIKKLKKIKKVIINKKLLTFIIFFLKDENGDDESVKDSDEKTEAQDLISSIKEFLNSVNN